MTGSGTVVTLYRISQRLYPRAFRHRYEDEMIQLFRDQLRDEPTWRVCGRAAKDLAVSVPTRHVEVHMARNRTPALVLIVALALAAVAFAFVEGLLGLVTAVLGAALSAMIWRIERPAPSQRRAVSRWWKPLAGGAALLAVVIGATTARGELSEPEWAVAAIAFLASLASIGVGVVFAIVHLSDRRASRGAAA